MKKAFNNTIYQDLTGQEDSGISPLFNESGAERVKPGALGLDKDNYLYNDTNADRYNSGIDVNQQQGQPKGVTPDLGPVDNFNADEKVFDDNEVVSFKRQSKIIDFILRR
jgi:hypothetical protein